MLVLVVAALAIRFTLSEDKWECGKNGEWVKRGNPSTEMPDWFCGDKNITNFERCMQAGYPVMESYPRQCKGPNEKTHVENIGNELDMDDMITIDNPRPNQKISSPLSISGHARGTWFFEGDFPVKLYKTNGDLIAEGIGSTNEDPSTGSGQDWMTEEFIAFTSELEFDDPDFKEGVLVLEKDNPSGFVENDAELRVPVKFE